MKVKHCLCIVVVGLFVVRQVDSKAWLKITDKSDN